MAKNRKTPLYALLGLALAVGAWVARGVLERKAPTTFEAIFVSSAVYMFYVRSDEALDIGISLLNRSKSDE